MLFASLVKAAPRHAVASTKSLHFLLLLLAALSGACGDGVPHGVLEEWVEHSGEVEVGSTVQGSQQQFAGPRQLRAAGFVQREDGTWERRAALSATPGVIALDEGALQHIGAVSVLSIDRSNAQVPYLYATLRAIFGELPDYSVVNVFVGDNKTAYVSLEKLRDELGAQAAQRVHVVPADDTVVAFMADNRFSLSERASWNYARMLRAYKGPLYHLTFEDDVLLSRGSVQVLDQLLDQDAPGTVSMYNNKCNKTPGTRQDACGKPYLASYRRDRKRSKFWGTQGVAYRGNEGSEIGHYIQAHLGEKPFDLLVDRFLKTHRRSLAYTQPSMVQHMGVVSTGLGFTHTSKCFPETFPVP